MRASPFAVPDRAPPHRRGAGPSTLRRQETVAETRRDATASATMPVVTGVLHLASHAIVDPRRATIGVRRRRAAVAKRPGSSRGESLAAATPPTPSPEVSSTPPLPSRRPRRRVRIVLDVRAPEKIGSHFQGSR